MSAPIGPPMLYDLSMTYLSPTPALPVARTYGATPGAARCLVASALARYAADRGVEPLVLRGLFASAFRAAVLGGWRADLELPHDVLLGLQSGPRVVVPLRGLRLHLPVDPLFSVQPFAVSLYAPTQAGLIGLPERAFGHPDQLMAAARVLRLPSDLGVLAVRQVVVALARPLAPGAAIVVDYSDSGLGWEAYQMVRVVHRVCNPATQIDRVRATALDRRAQPGDMLGVGLPVQDWLTPALRWMCGGG